MAEFCKQCDEEYDISGDPGVDARNLISEDRVKEGYAMPFLCEGCGNTLVNHLGECVMDCLKHHASPYPEGSEVQDG